MLIFWLWSCVIVGLCSAKCKQEDIIFTGDDKSSWVAEIKGELTPQVLAPKKTPISVDKDLGEIKVTIRAASGAIKLLAVSLETKNVKQIDVLGKTKTMQSANAHWVESSFKFNAKLVEEITVQVKTDDYTPKAALRSIYVKACVVEAPKTLEDEIEAVVNDLMEDVQSQDFDKIRKLYYTNEVIQLVQGDELKKGKEFIEKRLRRIIPRPSFSEIKFFDSGKLSKTRVYTAYEQTFYKDEAMSTTPIVVYRLSIVWKREDKRWKIDQIALIDDGTQCGQLTVDYPHYIHPISTP